MKNLVNIVLILVLLIQSIFIDVYFHLPEYGEVIYVLNVGQGDSILIKTIDNKYILIDTGPDQKALYQLQNIIPFWDRRIDLVFLTHADKDHIGGFPYIADYFDIGKLFFNLSNKGTEVYERTLDIIDKRDIITSPVNDLYNMQIGCCSYIDTLWPSKEFLESFQTNDEMDSNSISTAFVFFYNHFFMYFGGDLESEYEEKIFSENLYDLDAIKVGHHGSKTSTSEKFLDLTTPEVAVISVGENNRFRHPSEQVLNYLSARNIIIKRTDRDDLVKIYIKND